MILLREYFELQHFAGHGYEFICLPTFLPMNTYHNRFQLQILIRSKVRNMAGMFSAASYFRGGLNGWNTSQVTDMSSMFYQNRMGSVLT